MSHVAPASEYHGKIALSPIPASNAPVRKGLMRRFFDALMMSRERQSQRDIDSLVAWRDGRFTDAFEREIAERSYSDGWNFRR